jgi:hypothetical protein
MMTDNPFTITVLVFVDAFLTVGSYVRYLSPSLWKTGRENRVESNLNLLPLFRCLNRDKNSMCNLATLLF